MPLLRERLEQPNKQPNSFPASTGQDSCRRAVRIVDIDHAYAKAANAGGVYAAKKVKFVTDSETGERKQVELSTRVKPWWFPAASGKLVLALRYGAKSIEIVKGKNAIEVTGMDDLIATLEIIKDAVQAGELDAQIEQASGALRAGFAKKKK